MLDKLKLSIPVTRTRTEEAVVFPDHGRRSWRWVLDLKVLSLVLTHQFRSEKAPEWRPAIRYYGAGVLWQFRFGMESFYYDGEHRALNCGPFSLWWGW